MNRALLLEILAVLVVTAVAAALRFAALDAAPPGLYHDESAYGTLAAYVYHGNRETSFGEREPLFIYLLAYAIRFLGHDVLTLRLVAAFLGTLNIPLLYLLARLMFGRRVALLSAVVLATLYWHVSLSRTVFRALTLPVFETLAVALLWGALRRQPGKLRFALFALAGGALGLVLYTYIAARMLPLVVLVFLAGELLLGRRRLRPTWLNLPLYGASAALVFWPLGAFIIEYPEMFFARLEAVAVDGAAGGNLYLENALRVAGMFFFAGDTNWRHNYAGRPVFDPVFAAAFAFGILLCLRRWRAAESRFLLLWVTLMLVPTVASIDAPHFLRADGVLPPAAILAALGFVQALAFTTDRLPRLAPLWRPAGFAALTALCLASLTALTGYTYFSLWLQNPRTYFAFDGPQATAARYLANSAEWRANTAGGGNIFLSTRFWQDRAAMLFPLFPWLSGFDRDSPSDTRLGVRWLDEEQALPLPAGEATYLVADSDSWAGKTLHDLYGAGTVMSERATTHLPDVSPFTVLRIPAGVVPPAAGAALGAFGGAVTLIGYTLPDATPSGAAFDLVTRWQVQAVPPSWRAPGFRLSAFVHLLDHDGLLLTAADGLGFAPVDWRDGEQFLLRHRPQLPAGTAPGGYRLAIGLVTPDGKRVVLAGNPEGALTLPEALHVSREVNPVPGVPAQAASLTDGTLSLLGYALPTGAEVTPGQPLRLILYWRALGQPRGDYGVEVSLVGPDGKESARLAGQPVDGRYPTGEWRQGEIVRDPRQITLGARAMAGRHALRLTLVDAEGKRTGPTPIGEVTVREVPRLFAPPPGIHVVEAPNAFGQVAALVGYEMDEASARAGGKVRLTLYWRALAEVEERYKVFVHLVGPSGLVAQSDAEPAQNARPLTSWVKDEVVADTHAILLPAGIAAGDFALLVGLYPPAGGARLPLVDAAGTRVDDKATLATLPVAR